MSRTRREILSYMALSAAIGVLPRPTRAAAAEDLYAVGKKGNVRILHLTDLHGQVSPVRFREPNVNIGVGSATGHPPHLVGTAFLDHFHVPAKTARAHAFTYLDFEESSLRYGLMGGLAHIATLVHRLRSEAGEANTLLVDGGDSWQGSWIAHRTKGAGLVDLANMIGVGAMTSHWEMTYGEDTLRQNLRAFKGDFVAQNVFLTDEASFAGAEAVDPDTGRVFAPYVIKSIGGARVAILGQAFPYQPIAHPHRFVPDWTFGIREQEMQKAVNDARKKDKADAVILLSHNGMDVDLKLAGRVTGIDVILGGHTHDAVISPVAIKNSGGTTLVVNGGSNGKFLGVLDLTIAGGRVSSVDYTCLPIFSNLIEPDRAVTAKIADLRAPDASMLDERLASAGELLYRRGNFAGTMDQLICTALRKEMNAEIALSPGFRWGPSLLQGEDLTMDFLLSHTAMTYPDVYVQGMTGTQLKTVMEDVCDNLFNPDPYVQQGGDMVRLGGLDYVCTPSAAVGNRISDLALSDGTKIEADKTYRVAGWASVNLEQTGTPVWDVVAKYLRHEKVAMVENPGRIHIAGIDGNPGYAT